MQLAVEARGVHPDQAWAWWTDFREGAHDHAFARWAHPERRVERRPDGVVVLHESGRALGLRYEEVTEVRLARPRLHFDGRTTFGRFRGTFRFLPSPQGTRIEVAWDQQLRGPLRWLGPLGAWAVRRFFAWDLRHHVRDLEAEASSGGAGTVAGASG